jgi:N-methylhydantoinase B
MTIRAAVSRHGERLRFDFSGSSPCTRGPMNAPPSVTASAAYYVTLAVFGEGAAPNAGAYRPVDVVTQPGTLVHATEPFPVVAANTETATRIVDVLLGALAQAGDFAVAGSYGCAAVYTLGGIHPGTGRPFVHYETVGGGGGAGPGADGLDGLRVHMGNTMNLPIEALEARLPVAFEGYSLVPDSGGAGAHRGGEGVRKRFRVLADGVEFSMLLERTQSAAAGYRGGAAGAVASIAVERADGDRETLPSKVHVVLGRGDVVDIITAGGGGWGVPGTAPAAAVPATSSSSGPPSPSAPDR